MGLFVFLFICFPTVTHIVQVEPIFEQSMVYNEMYISSNPIESEVAPYIHSYTYIILL